MVVSSVCHSVLLRFPAALHPVNSPSARDPAAPAVAAAAHMLQQLRQPPAVIITASDRLPGSAVVEMLCGRPTGRLRQWSSGRTKLNLLLLKYITARGQLDHATFLERAKTSI